MKTCSRGVKYSWRERFLGTLCLNFHYIEFLRKKGSLTLYGYLPFDLFLKTQKIWRANSFVIFVWEKFTNFMSFKILFNNKILSHLIMNGCLTSWKTLEISSQQFPGNVAADRHSKGGYLAFHRSLSLNQLEKKNTKT